MIRQQRKIAYTYNVTTEAAAKPVSIADVKTHLKLSLSDCSEDAYIGMLIDAATEFGEKYTNRDFINKTYTTFRDEFCNEIELRRSQVSSVTSVSYLLNGVFTDVATTVYGLTDTTSYPIIYLKDDQNWPDGFDNIPQCIKIIFVSGYGANATSVPAAIRLALLNHIALMYENRGDCGDCGDTLPGSVKKVYDSYRIINIGSKNDNLDPYYYRY